MKSQSRESKIMDEMPVVPMSMKDLKKRWPGIAESTLRRALARLLVAGKVERVPIVSKTFVHRKQYIGWRKL